MSTQTAPIATSPLISQIKSRFTQLRQNATGAAQAARLDYDQLVATVREFAASSELKSVLKGWIHGAAAATPPVKTRRKASAKRP